jgi:hypothetical protein
MGSGHNVVLFDPAAAAATEVVYHRIARIQVRSVLVVEDQIRIDEYPHD